MKARTISTLVSLLLIGYSGYAQRFTYTYDASGNRIKREIPMPVAMAMEATTISEVKSNELIASKEGQDASQSLQPVDAFKVILYPNPTSGNFTLELPELQTGQAGKAQPSSIHIFDNLGKLCYQQGYALTAQSFNVSHYFPGYYVIAITIGDKKVSKILIKE